MSQSDVDTVLNAFSQVRGDVASLRGEMVAMEARLTARVWQTVFTVNTAMFGIVGLALLLFRTI
ncbi:MAG: hypothetical protein AB8B85_09020 [Paracoccaceae bacterium]